MILLFDGAMGTMLQKAGLKPGYCPELWNIECPEKITAIHQQYVNSGADILETNTFGANRIKLAYYGLEDKVALLNRAAVKAARAAAGPKTKVAGSVGPTGKFIEPLGEISFDTAYDVFFEQITALDAAGVDMIIIETIIDIQEMRAALLAAKSATTKPVICQLSFGADMRTVTGTDACTAAVILEAMGADVIGANCSLGPAQLLSVIEEIAKATYLPISVQPNAGMPELVQGETVFPMSPEEMALWAPKLVDAGASYIGGCCGTTPEHIRAMRESLQKNSYANYAPADRNICRNMALASRTKTVYLGNGYPTKIIGERINPTGRKALAEDIKRGDFISVKKEALSQMRAGADILDVNMGVPGIDQAKVMYKVVQDLSMLVDAPLAIDTTNAEALEAGLKAFAGRALVNSVSAEKERLETFLPLAKKYGAAILCLPITADGVPYTALERVTAARQIVDAALAVGLRNQDLLLDPLVLTTAADSRAGLETLETLRLYKKHFGYPTVMGLSNVSHGLPRRDLINATFCAMALASGLDAPIMNPYDPLLQDILAASAVLSGHDANAKTFLANYAAKIDVSSKDKKIDHENINILEQISHTVINGEKQAVIEMIKKALEKGYSPIDITEKGLIAGMNQIGEAFGKGTAFLPQIMLAAETMRIAFKTIQEVLPSHAAKSVGTIVLATVKGDIHDLGKNIVAALMENNGFHVIDLGKDVSSETIVENVQIHDADMVGLCALMTTTMPEINHSIAALKACGCRAKVIVGGAVLTAEYAAEAGADAYAPNAVEAVMLAKQLLKE